MRAAQRAHAHGAAGVARCAPGPAVFAHSVAGHAEFLPPVGQYHIDFAYFGTQAHEVETGAKTRLLDQAKWRRADPLVKARLHHPDFAHVGT